jgi:HPt (histidine-containing phosphotransfer) domain-containing protein
MGSLLLRAVGGGRGGSDGERPDRVLNEDLIESLVVDLGTDPVGALVDLFVDDAPSRIAALRAACVAGDAREAAKVAHLMKSAAGSIGARAYAARCGQVEQLAATGRLDEAGTQLDHFPADLTAAKDALAALLAGHSPATGGR